MKPVIIAQTDAFRNMGQFNEFRDHAAELGYDVLMVTAEAIDKVRIEPQVTLRDQFAMAALSGIIGSRHGTPIACASDAQLAARSAWCVADALLASRNNEKGGKTNG